ncbi:quinolinate synthase [Candidatus Marinamargulisbacteria bacterium SCGC AG-343-K17]|nr:quinolinate synthase [Candidatus Marinamargulisbacteria bacterium SCGC AG-343-K17]
MITADELQQKLSNISIGANTCNFNKETCEKYAPIINKINQLKKEKNAMILAHSYVSPEILYGVADHVGDSFELSKAAQNTECDIIIFAAVKFMAETAKILNPQKTVYTPSEINGCSLADSITADDVLKLKEQYPDHAFICYINTSAEVKALCDSCVTSSNVYQIIENFPNDNIYFLPDKLMGKNVEAHLKKTNSKKNFSYYSGTCYVHEEYDPDMIDYLKLNHPETAIVAHPECKPSIIEKSTFVGSTSQMVNYVKETNHQKYVMLTECGLTARLQMEDPSKQFIGSCTMCKYMKSNKLDQILAILESPNPNLEVQLDEKTIEKAKHSLLQMFKYTS